MNLHNAKLHCKFPTLTTESPISSCAIKIYPVLHCPSLGRDHDVTLNDEN